jgi:hypothetical protein
MKLVLGLTAMIAAIAGVGLLILNGVLVLPTWLLWSFFIASGNLIYTTVRHNNETERMTLVMTFILIAIQSLGWPEIAVATIIGVGIGELFQQRAWYKKLYNTVAISIAGVITEILFTYGDLVVFQTIVGTSLIFDAVLYTLLVPVWLWVAKQTIREIHESYWLTFYNVPVSAALAWTIITVVETFGAFGIMAIALAFLAAFRPSYDLPDWAVMREFKTPA